MGFVDIFYLVTGTRDSVNAISRGGSAPKSKILPFCLLYLPEKIPVSNT